MDGIGQAMVRGHLNKTAAEHHVVCVYVHHGRDGLGYARVDV